MIDQLFTYQQVSNIAAIALLVGLIIGIALGLVIGLDHEDKRAK